MMLESTLVNGSCFKCAIEIKFVLYNMKKVIATFYLTILTFFHRIVKYKLTIASYKVRITIYKVRIARYKLAILAERMFSELRVYLTIIRRVYISQF